MPKSTTVPKKPGAQTLHKATVALPAAVDAVHTPAGHCAVVRPRQNQPTGQTVVFVVAPGAQKMLLAQVAHVALLLAPACVENEPSGQLVQDELDGAPSVFWKVPAGHDWHTAFVVALTLVEKVPVGHATGAPPGQ